jgi:hypothetical protein
MITKEKIAEVRRSLSKGIPQGELQNDLLNEGYSEDDIKQVFSPHKYDMRSWYLVFAIILFLGGVWALLTYHSFLPVIFSAILFSAYYNERKKIKKERSE